MNVLNKTLQQPQQHTDMFRPILRPLLLTSLLFSLSFTTWADDSNQEQITEPSQQETYPEERGSDKSSDKAPLPLTELRTFTEVFDIIKKAYVEDTDDKDLLENAIQGMLTALDPHSAYLKPEAYEDLQVNTTGEFGGLGIEVGMENGFVKVITPIDGTPAEEAGILAGDLIIKLDNTPVKGLSLGDAVKLMRGKAGSDIVLSIVREGADRTLEITVTRAVIKARSVRNKLLAPNYGYIRLSQFQVPSGLNVRKSLDSLIEENNNTALNGLILDLRNNPGGVLQASAEVSDVFLNGGLVVYTKGRLSDSEMELRATPGDALNGAPLVVLVNGGSASASEIVAGALQDHKRAVIMGTQSFGKGSVQTVRPLPNNRAIKLTTARYFTPNGRSIQAQGITPDILVENAKLTKVNGYNYIKEADLSGHLENPAEGNTSNVKGSQNVQKSLQERDYQLYEALNLLKALNVVGAYSDNKTVDAEPNE
ncbi:peptidase S41 [Gammaproteobacteria bacterium 42_54_T18]|nr:peptidase S41 [Gammaproteobacteria bacterium 42_54_T18]